jgi:ATP-dependent Clp endopeptidase proteolytic subunit ClpP
MESKERKRVILNSPGGSVSEGIEIHNLIKSYGGDVEIIIGVMAASITSYIAMAVPKEKRKGFKNSSMMIHEASAAIYGRARDFKIRYERLMGVNNILAEAYAENLGKTKDEALQMMSEDFYMTGWEQLLENGAISDIVEPSDIDIPEPMENEPDFFTMLFAELEKEPDANKIRESMYAAEEKAMKDMEASEKNFERMAALLEIKPEIKPDDNNIQGDKMNLQDFLKSNPEAMAEYSTALETAKASGADGVQAQIQADRERLAKILKLENAKISAAAESAIIGETPVVDYLEAKLLEQENIRADKKKSPFSEIVAGQTPADQNKIGAEEQKNKGALSVEEFNAKLEAYREQRAKKNGGKK